MRKLQQKQFVPKETDVIKATELFFDVPIDVDKLVQEARHIEQQHPFTKKTNVGGWNSIPLRSAGGITGVSGSSASGTQKSSDSSIFQDTELMQFAPYISSLVRKVAFDDDDNANAAGVLKVRLMQLEAHRVIAEHVDMFDGEHAKAVKRFHIPIITNPKISFFVNRQKYYLEPGQLYHIDVSQVHSVENNSDVNRVHLVFDVLATTRVCKNLIDATKK